MTTLIEQRFGIRRVEVCKETPLMEACIDGNGERVDELLGEGVDVNASRSDGWTALMFACSEGHEDIVVRLVKGGANVNAVDKWGQSPLHIASYHHHHITRYLVDEGNANVLAEYEGDRASYLLDCGTFCPRDCERCAVRRYVKNLEEATQVQ